MQHYYERNNPVHAEFLELLKEPSHDKKRIERFHENAKKLHNVQWSEHVWNIVTATSQCPNKCRYCYMTTIRQHFFNVEPTQDIEDMQITAKAIAKNWRKAKENDKKMFMTPSSHDIVPYILQDYIISLRKILEAGHDLLIVSKPRMDCIIPIANAFEAYKNRIIFRLTITSTDERILQFWEKNAPSLRERMDVLRTLYSRGFITSVSAEPYLSHPGDIAQLVAPFVNETIWLGVMSGKLNCDATEAARLRELYSLDFVGNLMRRFHVDINDPLHAIGEKIRWKAKMMKEIIN